MTTITTKPFRNPTARELRAMLYEIGNQDAPLSDEVMLDLVQQVAPARDDAPRHPLLRLAYYLHDRIEYVATAHGLEVVHQFPWPVTAHRGRHLITHADGRYQVEGGPSFTDAQECADMLVAFEADHGDDAPAAAAQTPLAWARSCRDGEMYSYAALGMVPVLEAELEALEAECLARGLELYADDHGLRVVSFDDD